MGGTTSASCNLGCGSSYVSKVMYCINNSASQKYRFELFNKTGTILAFIPIKKEKIIEEEKKKKRRTNSPNYLK